MARNSLLCADVPLRNYSLTLYGAIEIIVIIITIIFFLLRPLAQSRRSNYGWIWLLLRFECARKRECICLLDHNGKTLKEVSGLEWITRDSCCASANFLGQLSGLSIPRTRSLNNIMCI